VRRAAVERVGGLDPRLHYVMDWDLWLRLERAGCVFHFLEAPLAAVRVHEGTKTLSGAAERYSEIRALLRTAGVPWVRRLAIVMGFHSYDLRNRRGGVLRGVARRLLATAAATRASLTRRARPRINGLECWTNRVERECVVELPWYDPHPPSSVTLVSDHAVDLSLVCNGRPTTVQRCGAAPTTFLGERIAGQGYRASIAPGSPSTLSFRVASRDAPWRLLSLAGVA
jgi:hypothetical protein